MDGRLIQDENLKTVERAIIDLKAQSKAPSTLVAYGCDLRRLARKLSEINLTFQDLDKHNLVDLLNAVKVNEAGRTLSSGRINGLFSSLNALMKYLEYTDEIEYNAIPMFRERYLTSYKRKQSTGIPRQCPTNEQVKSVIDGSPMIRDQAIHMVLAKTGLRNKELRALDVSDVDLVEKCIIAKPTTKRDGLKLPIDDECTVYLDRWLWDRRTFPSANEEKALFLNDGGSRLGRNTLLRIINRDGERQGLHDPDSDIRQLDRRYTPHVYRHWMTTTLRESGCSERVIRYIRGDAEGSSADRYDHLRWETVQREYLAAMPLLLSLA